MGKRRIKEDDPTANRYVFHRKEHKPLTVVYSGMYMYMNGGRLPKAVTVPVPPRHPLKLTRRQLDAIEERALQGLQAEKDLSLPALIKTACADILAPYLERNSEGDIVGYKIPNELAGKRETDALLLSKLLQYLDEAESDDWRVYCAISVGMYYERINAKLHEEAVVSAVKVSEGRRHSHEKRRKLNADRYADWQAHIDALRSGKFPLSYEAACQNVVNTFKYKDGKGVPRPPSLSTVQNNTVNRTPRKPRAK